MYCTILFWGWNGSDPVHLMRSWELLSGAKVRCVPPIYMYSRLPKLFVIKDPLPDSFVGLLFYIHVI